MSFQIRASWKANRSSVARVCQCKRFSITWATAFRSIISSIHLRELRANKQRQFCVTVGSESKPNWTDEGSGRLKGRHLAILELWTNHRPTLEKYFLLIGKTAKNMTPGEYRSLKAP